MRTFSEEMQVSQQHAVSWGVVVMCRAIAFALYPVKSKSAHDPDMGPAYITTGMLLLS